jgi:hypothetical protein
MRVTIAILVAWACSTGVPDALHAQRGTPEADVFLAPLTVRDGRAEVGPAVNVTNRPGYDNQPSFTPDSRSILYTSTREDAQSDIYRYDIAAHAITRVRKTPESEYSAAVMPGGGRFSVIRVEMDSTQRLWSFALDGTDPRVILPAIKPVGYHAWADSTHLALFVLGAGRAPATLQFADIRTSHVDTIARNIGRSLLPIPGGHGFSFIQYGADTSLVVVRLDPKTGVVTSNSSLVKMPFRTDYVAWLGRSLLIAGNGNTLVEWTGSGDWTPVADLSSVLTGVSRLAVSPDGKWLAIVAAPK